MNNLKLLKDSFINVLGVKSESEVSTITYGQSEKWDSLAHILLISDLESVFHIQFDTNEIINITRYDDIIKVLTDHGITF